MRLIFWCLCLLPAHFFATPLTVDLQARSAILINLDTGAILYEKEAHSMAYPASTTKIATALFILEQKKIPLTQKVTVSQEALRKKPLNKMAEAPSHWQELDGSMMGLVPGEVVNVETLLHGLLLSSGNDAANVLAETASGSVPKFMEELNQYMQRIGCEGTRFSNPHGLHHLEHVTTAYDLALLAQKAFQIPKFRDIVSRQSFTKPQTNKQSEIELKQSNRLVTPSKYFYPKAIGGKTGYHSAAMNTLVAAATHEGRTLIAVLLGSPKKHERCFNDATRLFEAAFAEKKVERLLISPSEVYAKTLPGAKAPLKASLSESLSIAYYPSEEPQAKAFIHWDTLTLPIRQGARVGEVRIFDERGRSLAQGPLIAQEPVDATFLFVLQETWHKLFR